MTWKRRAPSDLAWYDPQVAPFYPFFAPGYAPDGLEEAAGPRRKSRASTAEITPIGEPPAPSPDPPPAALERRPADALEKVTAPRDPGPAPPCPAKPPPASPPPPLDPELHAIQARLEREAQRRAESERRALLTQLLPVLDNLDRSVAAAASSPDQALLQGVRMVRDQLASVLADLGATRIACVGQPFDPTYHEAVAVTEVDDPDLDGKVVDEWEAGYRIGDRLLRPARVRVGRFRLPASAGSGAERDD